MVKAPNRDTASFTSFVVGYMTHLAFLFRDELTSKVFHPYYRQLPGFL